VRAKSARAHAASRPRQCESEAARDEREQPAASSSSRREALAVGALLGVAGAAPALAAIDYDRDIAENYDSLNQGTPAEAFGIPELRGKLLSRASGEVLEIGVGTGLNLPYYAGAGTAVSSLTAVDLSEDMLAVAERRAAAKGLVVELGQADIMNLPYSDGSFDTVVDTFSLCVLDDPAGALREVRRVLRPGGRALLLEHTRAGGALGLYQDATAGAVRAMGKGCAWNQDVRALAAEAQLEVVSADSTLAGLLTALELRPL